MSLGRVTFSSSELRCPICAIRGHHRKLRCLPGRNDTARGFKIGKGSLLRMMNSTLHRPRCAVGEDAFAVIRDTIAK